MGRKAIKGRQLLPPDQLTDELRERMAKIALVYNDLKDLSNTVQIPHTILPSVQSTCRFLQFAGDHIQAAITLSETIQ